MKKAIILLILTVVLGFTISPSVNAGVVYSTRPWLNNNIFAVCVGDSGASMAGVGMLTTEDEPYVLSNVTLKLYEIRGGAEVTLDLYDGTESGWGTQLTTLGTVQIGPMFSFNNYTFAPESPIILDPDSIYWFVISSSHTFNCAAGWAGGGAAPTGEFERVGEGHFINGSYSDVTGSNFMVTIDALLPGEVDGDVNLGSYGKIGQVRVVAPGMRLYERAGGGVVRNAAGNEVWIPNQNADNPNEDTYDVIAKITIDGTTWVMIFNGNSVQAAWIPLGGPVTVSETLEDTGTTEAK